MTYRLLFQTSLTLSVPEDVRLGSGPGVRGDDRQRTLASCPQGAEGIDDLLAA